MKIAIPAAAPNLDARVEHRLGTASYLMVIDPDNLTFETVKGPSTLRAPGSGIQAISLILGMGAKTLLTGYISPDIARTLRQNHIEVITPVKGSVREVVERYKRGEFSQTGDDNQQFIKNTVHLGTPGWREALRKATRQFTGMLPVLIGLILIVGLLNGFLPRKLLLSAFSGNAFQDTMLGVLIGSMLAGNPINSYVMGETLLKMGVSLFGVTALMLAWVSVWVIQIPAEKSAMGMRFAVTRALTAFFIAIPASLLIVLMSRSSG
jgi:predicted Fe-Mo cluster-binding NifX family protein